MDTSCGSYRNGKCVDGRKCEPFMEKDFDCRFEVIEMDKVCKRRSVFGNNLFLLTAEDIEALRSGKVLCSIDEYGTFIAMDKKEFDEL